MRLWHTDLIKVLPRQQLLGQWRELNSIYKLQNKHILINFIYEYSKKDLYNYSIKVLNEMTNRGYKANISNFCNYFNIKNITPNFNEKNNIFKDKMTNRYLMQCLFNLQEKYDCGGISNEEWEKIYKNFNNFFKTIDI